MFNVYGSRFPLSLSPLLKPWAPSPPLCHRYRFEYISVYLSVSTNTQEITHHISKWETRRTRRRTGEEPCGVEKGEFHVRPGLQYVSQIVDLKIAANIYKHNHLYPFSSTISLLFKVNFLEKLQCTTAKGLIFRIRLHVNPACLPQLWIWSDGE